MTDASTMPKKTGASLARGRSETVVGTPRVFLDAVERRWGPLTVDLAATAENAKAPHCITPEQDSLVQDWYRLQGNLWLNPPYDDIGPWAKKCVTELAMAPLRGWRVLFLVPASIGSNWFAEHVYCHAAVHALKGRLTFNGHKDPYPKDLILAEYGSLDGKGFDVWDWRRS